MQFPNLVPGSRKDPTAQLRSKIERHLRQCAEDKAKVPAAHTFHRQQLELGATDEVLDSAAREIVLAERRVTRNEIALIALNSEMESLVSAQRAANLERLMSAAIDMHLLHAGTARSSFSTAIGAVCSRNDLVAAGFAREAAELPTLIPYVFSLEDSHKASFPAQASFSALEKFAFDCEVLRRSREKSK